MHCSHNCRMFSSPMLVATTQAAALSGASNVAAQFIETYQSQVSDYLGTYGPSNPLYAATDCQY